MAAEQYLGQGEEVGKYGYHDRRCAKSSDDRHYTDYEGEDSNENDHNIHRYTDMIVIR